MLESSRLILRPLTSADADDLLEYQSDPDVIRFIPWPVRDREMVAEAITKLLEFIGTGETGLNQTYAMELKSSGKVIGQVNYMFKDGHDFQREIGYLINGSINTNAGKSLRGEIGEEVKEFTFAGSYDWR